MELFSEIQSLPPSLVQDLKYVITEAIQTNAFEHLLLTQKNASESSIYHPSDDFGKLQLNDYASGSSTFSNSSPIVDMSHFPSAKEVRPAQEVAESSQANKKRKVSKACGNCQKSHISCDGERPCRRCLSKGITTECVDPIPKKRGRPKKFADGLDKNEVEHLKQRLSMMNSVSIFPEVIEDIQIVETNDIPNVVFPSAKIFSRLHKYISVRVPDMVDEYNKFLKYIRPGIVSIIRKIEQPTITKIMEQFNQALKFYKDIAETIAIPTIVWDKSNTIHCVNSAFRQLTGFSSLIPTRPEAFELYSLLSPSSIRRLIATAADSWNDGTTNSIILPIELLAFGKFIDCMMCLEIKRYEIGLPMLHIGHIIPVVSQATYDLNTLPWTSTKMEQLVSSPSDTSSSDTSSPIECGFNPSILSSAVNSPSPYTTPSSADEVISFLL